MQEPQEPLQLPSPCLVVLVGPGAFGKSTWAAAHFPAEIIVSSDALRALVGAAEDDISASADAFGLLDAIIDARLRRHLTTVIDTLGLDGARRRAWAEAAHRWQVPCVAVTFDTSAAECRARNRERAKPIPSAALSAQLRSWSSAREQLSTDGFDLVIPAAPVRVVPKAFASAAESARRQAEAPTGLRFGLHIGTFSFPGGASATRQALPRHGRRGRIRRVRLDICDGPFQADPSDRPSVGGFSRELYDACLSRWLHRTRVVWVPLSPASLTGTWLTSARSSPLWTC